MHDIQICKKEKKNFFFTRKYLQNYYLIFSFKHHVARSTFCTKFVCISNKCVKLAHKLVIIGDEVLLCKFFCEICISELYKVTCNMYFWFVLHVGKEKKLSLCDLTSNTREVISYH